MSLVQGSVVLCIVALLRHHRLPALLLAERESAHLEDGLEALTALDGVLLELADRRLLHRGLDLLPAATDGRHLGLLVELGLRVACRPVDDGLLHGDEVCEGEVRRAHGDFLRLRVNVGGLEDVGGFLPAHHREEPFRCGLFAGYETFSSELEVGVSIHSSAGTPVLPGSKTYNSAL